MVHQHCRGVDPQPCSFEESHHGQNRRVAQLVTRGYSSKTNSWAGGTWFHHERAFQTVAVSGSRTHPKYTTDMLTKL